MAFNSNTYHRNKARREALAYLGQARDMKAQGYPERTAWYVDRARNVWRLYLSYLMIKHMDDDMKLCREGKMRYADFTAKWSAR